MAPALYVDIDRGSAIMVLSIVLAVVCLPLVYELCKCMKCIVGSDATGTNAYEWLSNIRIRGMSIEKFLSEIDVREKPFRFKRAQIVGFTRCYSSRLGAGSFSTVFKGALPNGLAVAVKLFNRDLDVEQEEERFLAAVGTMWRTRHVNLVSLLGFCFDDAVRALVYEYVDNGALDAYLLRDDDGAGLLPAAALLDIAVGVAKGIRHLHEECKEKVVHHDIKPSSALLDGALKPKVADVGLAQLLNADTHVILSTSLPTAATRRDVAPEVRVQDITEKRDVYSFGMLLLEIVVRKSIFDNEEAAPESRQQWFPELAWIKYETGGLMDLVVTPSRDHTVPAIDDDDVQKWKELVERMCKVAFWCVQQEPAARPSMGEVVKMLEGEMNIAAPPANPFQDAMTAPVVTYLRTKMTSSSKNTTMKISGNTATGNGVSDGTQVIGSRVSIVQTVIQSDES